MLDALRHHKPTPPDGGEAGHRGAAGHDVLASLAQAFGRQQPDEVAGTGKRLGLALLLVGVTALLLWQVAAMNELLPAWPFPRLLRPVAAERPYAAQPAGTDTAVTGCHPARRAPGQHGCCRAAAAGAPGTWRLMPRPRRCRNLRSSGGPATPRRRADPGCEERRPGLRRRRKAPLRPRPFRVRRQAKRIISSWRSTTSASAISRTP